MPFTADLVGVPSNCTSTMRVYNHTGCDTHSLSRSGQSGRRHVCVRKLRSQPRPAPQVVSGCSGDSNWYARHGRRCFD